MRARWRTRRSRGRCRRGCRSRDRPGRGRRAVEHLAVVGEMIRLAAHLAVPVEAQPAQILEDGRLELRPAAADVGVLDAHQEFAAGLARPRPGDQRRIGAAEMQQAGRAGGKTRDDRLHIWGHDRTLQRARVTCYAGSMPPLVLDKANLKKALRHLARVDPDLARALKEVGPPELREMPTGYGGLMRSIVGQQVSVHAARSIWLRLEAAVQPMEPHIFLERSDEQLRAVGLSGAKMRYGRSLAADIVEGRIDFAALHELDDAGRDRHADPGQGHRPMDGRDLPDVRARPARHHARPRSRPGGRGPAPQAPAQAARRQAPAQDRRGVAAVAKCCGAGALALSPQHARLERQGRQKT